MDVRHLIAVTGSCFTYHKKKKKKSFGELILQGKSNHVGRVHNPLVVLLRQKLSLKVLLFLII